MLPFPLKAMDSDNGSEFINHHVYRYCKKHGIQFTRGRPYKKDDNAHTEQKNWTHVRKLLGSDRYDTPEALAAMNALYRGAWRAMMNLFQPCVTLKEKVRMGSRITRRYDNARTPLDHLVTCYGEDRLPDAVTALLEERTRTGPFALSADIDRQVAKLTRPRAAKNVKSNTHIEQRSPAPRGGADKAQTTSPAPYAW